MAAVKSDNNSATNEGVREVEHCWVPMKDGARLSARLWLPAKLPAPTIVEYIPYRKRDMVRARDERNHSWFAAHGYVCIRVDMRGSGDSEGLMPDMYSREELDDALTVLAWIKAQDWCDDAVGMMGTSWGGTSALQAAMSNSGLLKAVIAVCATDDRYRDDIHHMGGCLLTDSIEWGATLPAILALPPAVDSDPDGWRDNWLDRLEHIEFPLLAWIEHETRDTYWQHGSVNESPGKFDCPVLVIGGWADRYSNTVMNLLADNPGKSWGIVGPWGHHYPDQGVPGPAIGFQQQALRWWDHWLRNQDNGVNRDPQLQVWCNGFQKGEDFIPMRDGQWFALSEWSGHEKFDQYDLKLQTEHDSAAMVSIPNDLQIGGASGDTGYFGRPGGLPLDQGDDDSRSLVFETGVFESDQVILGKARVGLDLQTDKLPAQIVIRLNDVAPSGEVVRVAYRVHNLALDHDYQPADTDSIGQVVHYDLELPNAAHIFTRGHRIRIALSTSYWPQIWPPAETVQTEIDPGSIKLNIPLMPDSALMLNPSFFSDSLTPVDRDPDRISDRIRRETEFDETGNQLVYRWHQPRAMTRYEKIDIEIGAETTAEHRICVDDPTTASSCFVHRLSSIHGNRQFETRGEAQVFAERDYYRVEGILRAFEDGNEVFKRDWSRKIVRKYA